MKIFRNLVRTAVTFCAGVLAVATVVAQPDPPGLERAAAVKAARADQLLAGRGIVGAGVGLDQHGHGALHVMVVDEATAASIPREMDGVPVVVQVTGEIVALRDLDRLAGSAARTTGHTDPAGYFARPVPIGVSTGNAKVGTECAAGTIGCRVKSGTAVYVLSNNHVFARENAAGAGEPVSQPGPYDTRCYVDPKYDLGALSKFVTISFKTVNTVDAAIATTDTQHLGKATPADGYGAPRSTPVSAVVGQAVQKYGRTTALTKGAVSAINVSISVGYSGGTARFDNQIQVYARKAFIKAGDSGSLLVTDPGRNPVGLLFAGNSTGQYAFANPIGPVLSTLSVAIDGE